MCLNEWKFTGRLKNNHSPGRFNEVIGTSLTNAFRSRNENHANGVELGQRNGVDETADVPSLSATNSR